MCLRYVCLSLMHGHSFGTRLLKLCTKVYFYTGTDIWKLSCVGDIGLQAHLLLHWDRHTEAILC